MLSRLRDLFRGAKAPTLSHPVFGEISLHRGKKGPYWMHEAYERGDLTISIESRTGEPPSEAQVHFYVALTTDWNATYERVSSLLVPRYEQFLRKPFPTEWQSALIPAGVGVPIDGSNDNPWDVTFECITDDLGYLLTCYFEGGSPSGVTLDT